MHKASYYTQKNSAKVQCQLCPHVCILDNEQWGKCKVRQSRQGVLYDAGYARVSAFGLDPVEKKPLYHFYPGASILSVGGLGCNLSCEFCQNYTISQLEGITLKQTDYITHDAIVNMAVEKNPQAGIAFTYNEPIVNYDFMFQTAQLATSHHIPTAMVSNGYINPSPLARLLNVTDAFNIDLKAFNDDFYNKFTGAKLKPVLNALKQIADAGKHLEITHLVISGANDNIEEFTDMIQWIADHLGPEVPLHISRYFPQYKSHQAPTQTRLIEKFVKVAREKLDFVYPGNMVADASTYCPKCGAVVIQRNGFKTEKVATSGNKCLQCNYKLPIKI